MVSCPLLAVHAAVIAINEAIDKGQTKDTMSAMNNPNAMLRNTNEMLAQDYQDTLSQAKRRKQTLASRRVRHMGIVFVINSNRAVEKKHMHMTITSNHTDTFIV